MCQPGAEQHSRYDEHNHLIVGIFDKAGKAHRKNCKQCYANTKQQLKTVYQCTVSRQGWFCRWLYWTMKKITLPWTSKHFSEGWGNLWFAKKSKSLWICSKIFFPPPLKNAFGSRAVYIFFGSIGIAPTRDSAQGVPRQFQTLSRETAYCLARGHPPLSRETAYWTKTP